MRTHGDCIYSLKKKKEKKGISFTVLVARLHSLKASHINGSASPGLCAREWITMLISAGFVRVQRQLTWRLGRVDTMPSRQPTCPPLRWCCADKITNKRFVITLTRWTKKKKKSGERDTSGECLSEWARAKESKQLLFSQRCGLLFQLEGCRPNRKSTLRCEEHIPPSFIHSSFLGLFHQPLWFNSPQMGWKCLHMAWAKNQVLIMVIFAGNMNNGKYGEGITWKEGSNARRKKGRGGGGRKGGEKGRERGQERRQTCSFGRQKKKVIFRNEWGKNKKEVGQEGKAEKQLKWQRKLCKVYVGRKKGWKRCGRKKIGSKRRKGRKDVRKEGRKVETWMAQSKKTQQRKYGCKNKTQISEISQENPSIHFSEPLIHTLIASTLEPFPAVFQQLFYANDATL